MAALQLGWQEREPSTVGDVGVPGDPAAVRGAPVDVAEVVVKHVLERGRRAHHVAAQRVLHALGLAGRAARVQLRACT